MFTFTTAVSPTPQTVMSPTVIPFPATSPDKSAVARLLRSSNGTSISRGTWMPLLLPASVREGKGRTSVGGFDPTTTRGCAVSTIAGPVPVRGARLAPSGDIVNQIVDAESTAKGRSNHHRDRADSAPACRGG